MQHAFADISAPLSAADSISGAGDHRQACVRVGIDHAGAHRFRHTLATDLLPAGASLPDIGQVLRHRSQLSSTIYAKVDDANLQELVRPWPGNPTCEETEK
nr:tyrosine-type recombinase/integrase [Arthrobacter sp. MYb227]